MKAIGWGILVLILCLVTFYAFGEFQQGINIAFYFGVGCLLLAGIFSGAFTSGDRIRAKNSSYYTGDQGQRNRWSFFLFLLGVPSLVISIIYYFFENLFGK